MADPSIALVVKEVESALKIRIYSHKYSIVSFIYDNPYSTCLDIRKMCQSSNSTFYKSLRELRDAKIILPLRSSSDMRTRSYHLSPDVKVFLEKRHRSIGECFGNKLSFEGEKKSSLVTLVKSIESEIGFRYYSAEFEIIIFLYDSESSSPSSIMRNISSSNAYFYCTLKRLLDDNIIEMESFGKLGRKKFYRLSDRTTAILDSAHRTLVDSELL